MDFARVASLTPLQAAGGCGARQRRSPTGGDANGMPRNAVTSPSTDGSPLNCPWLIVTISFIFSSSHADKRSGPTHLALTPCGERRTQASLLHKRKHVSGETPYPVQRINPGQQNAVEPAVRQHLQALRDARCGAYQRK